MLSFPKARSGKPLCTAAPAPQKHPGRRVGALGGGGGGGQPSGRAPPLGWQGQPTFSFVPPDGLLAALLSFPGMGTDACLAPSGCTLSEQMAQHPWLLGRGEEAKRPQKNSSSDLRGLMPTSLFTPIGGFPGSWMVPAHPECRGRSWRAHEQRLGVCSQDRMSRGRNSREVPAAL